LLPQVPESRGRIDRAEDKPAPLSAKVPFGSSRPTQRPLFASAPRPTPEEKPALQETGAGSRSGGPSLFSGLFGGKADAEPDIDYDTPAFLRNQAD
jgi:hypothetical protein